MLGKVTVEKRLKQAGATPLFCGQTAQKFGGVAPALRHSNLRRSFFHGDTRIGRSGPSGNQSEWEVRLTAAKPIAVSHRKRKKS